jgi:hypothetical protein
MSTAVAPGAAPTRVAGGERPGGATAPEGLLAATKPSVRAATAPTAGNGSALLRSGEPARNGTGAATPAAPLAPPGDAAPAASPAAPNPAAANPTARRPAATSPATKRPTAASPAAASPTATRPVDPAATRPVATGAANPPATKDPVGTAPRAKAPTSTPPGAGAPRRPTTPPTEPRPTAPVPADDAVGPGGGGWAGAGSVPLGGGDLGMPDVDLGAHRDGPEVAPPVLEPTSPADASHPYFDLPYDNSDEPLVSEPSAGRRIVARAAAVVSSGPAAPADTRPPPPAADEVSATTTFDPLPPLVIGDAPAPPLTTTSPDPSTKRGKGKAKGKDKSSAAEAAPDEDVETVSLPPIIPGAMPAYGGTVTYGAAAPAKKKGPGPLQIVAITMSLAAALLVVYVAFTNYSATSDASARARTEAEADAKKPTTLGAFDFRTATTLAPGQVAPTTVAPVPLAYKAVDGSYGVTFPAAAQVVPVKLQAPDSASGFEGTRTYAVVGDRAFVVEAFEVPGANPATPAATVTAAQAAFGNGATVLSSTPTTVAGRPAALVEVQTANGYYGVATIVASGSKAFVVYEAMPMAAKPASAAAATAGGEYQAFVSTFAPA